MRYKRVTLAMLWPLFLGGTIVGVQAAQTMNARTNYFPVTAASLGDLRQNLVASRPWGPEFPWDARTDWWVNWDITWQQGPEGVTPRVCQVRTRVTITLPRWLPAPSTPPELYQAWWSYLTALARHEQGHLEIAREAGNEMERRLRAMPPWPTASQAHAEANRIAAEVLGAFRKRERSYDLATRHGAAQGAFLAAR